MPPESTGPALCGAKTRSGGTCQRQAGWGTPSLGYGRCRLHGGASPGGMKHAAMLEARATAVTLGAPESIDPHDALELCCSYALGEVRLADHKIRELTADQLAGPLVTTVRRRVELDGADGESTPGVEVEQRTGAATVNVWVAFRAQALERLAKFAKMAADAGVDERRVRVQERQVAALADVVNAVIADLRGAGLSAELERLAADSFRRHAALLDVVPGHAVEVTPA